MRLALATLLLAAAGPALAQPTKEQLLKPPATATEYSVISLAGQHGTAWRWRQADGSWAARFSMNLRGQLFETEDVERLDARGRPERLTIRGFTPTGDAAETFAVANGRATWKNKLEDTSVAHDGRAWYFPLGSAVNDSILFNEALWKAPGRRLPLLPGGEARLAKLTDVAIGKGPTARTVQVWAVEGVGLEPQPVVYNRDGGFFGVVGTVAVLPKGYEADFLKIQQAQDAALAARNPANVRRFGRVSPVPVAFTNVRLFDAENARFLDNQTVVTNGGAIAAVGPAASVKAPPNARVIDGRGKTLSPGLWDAHMHVGSDLQGIMLLSMGETSARDPGADIQPTIERRARIARGELLFPTVYSSVLIDGKGPLSAQGGIAVTSADEAIAGVRRAKAAGFTGVKFYTSFNPAWLPAATAEAHRLGLHVHGHVPQTIRPADAIARGYDEITHINMVMMQAMPDEVVDVFAGIQRFHGPGRYGKDVNLDAAPMKPLIAELATKKIVVDPTVSTFESLYVPDDGDLSPAYAPFVGTMPPQVERGFRLGGFKPPEGVTRADWRASFARMMQLTRKLHEAGVPIVAGTDGGGLELVRELELYVDAGLTPGQALQAATLTPARLVGADKTTGSIAVGKEADLVLVDGDPSRRIGDLRRTLWVMSDGKLMNADELRQAAGFSGRPK